MGHGHGHGAGMSASGQYVRPLALSFGVTAAFMVLELVTGALTGSLALISDAAHMLTDVVGVGMALAAIMLAKRARRSATKTFGMYRAEVLAALLNAVLLFGVAAYVTYEAVGKFRAPEGVPGLPVLIVGFAGLLANVFSFLLLRRGAQESLNVRGAYLEVLSDLLGSIGVLVSGAITLWTGWPYADPIIGVAIGLFVLPRAWSLGRNALRILFQHAPAKLDVDGVAASLGEVAGVGEVHDIHIWTLTSGMEVASAHLAVTADADPGVVLAAAQRLLKAEYDIDHATLQVETPNVRCAELSW
ncbi:cation diffusion facilitator family transporter [Sciscionella sediminilitoris]|uniref:cation diffusion facilitator family transporter n=1 Tax=Sciscionella sediminilitoris TaxID=1445613 RepID=UPI0004DF08A2|nr:cation diffusion facilitator family transporter [Sciscionella sp. SE31]